MGLFKLLNGDRRITRSLGTITGPETGRARNTFRVSVKNKVAVYLSSQNPSSDSPAHGTTRSFASLLLSARLARPVAGGAALTLQLITKETWREVKSRFRNVAIAAGIPVINPPRAAESLMLSYPPTPYETDGRRRQAELWMRADRF